MTGPENCLPGSFNEAEICALLTSIDFPHPTSIRPLKVTAAFHIIYILTYNSEVVAQKLSTKPKAPSTDLLLRIAGDHVPSLKTENESAVLSWVRENTSVPVPDVLWYDATTSNSLKHEYMLVNRCPGVPVSDIYEELSPAQLDFLVNQLIDVQEELHAHEFSMIGGLMHSPNDPKIIIPGPIMDEWFWFLPDIEFYFANTSETFSTLNATGPFPDYVTFVTSTVEKYMHTAKIHPSLEVARKYIPRLDAFLAILPQHAAVLNHVSIRLAHKDLHFANILCDPDTLRITAIIDWEFSGTVPFPRWDPARAFLWNGRLGEAALVEKNLLRDRFKEICEQRDIRFIRDAEFTSPLQESMHSVMNTMRWFVTMVPKGGNVDWVEKAETNLIKELQAFSV